jgi:hypothetical protein
MRGLFRGMVMEKLNGPTMADALRKPAGMQDVHYIRSMLFQARESCHDFLCMVDSGLLRDIT